MTRAPSMWVYGAGRTGLAVARLARARGLPVVGLWSHRPLDKARAALASGFMITVSGKPEPTPADLWLLAVPDDAIAEVTDVLASRLADPGAARPQAAAHCAGGRRWAELAALSAAGVACGSWHPAMTFRGAASDETALATSWVAIAGAPAARALLERFTEALGLAWHVVAEDERARYHSALVLAANGRVALDAAALRLLGDAGLDAGTARRVLAPLVARIEENLRAEGPRGAMTGPVARGDIATVRAQLEALSDVPAIRRLYRALAEALVSLVDSPEESPAHRALADLVAVEEGEEGS